jgi:hypothetical protein
MNLFHGRRPQQQLSRALFLTGMAWLMCACTDGVGTPLVLAADAGDGGGVALGSSGRSGSRIGTGTGMDASLDDDSRTQTTECAKIESMWPSKYATDETKLIDQINLIRAGNGLCSRGFVPLVALESDDAVQCTGRLRVVEEPAPKGPVSRPMVAIEWDVDNDRKAPEPDGLRDRQRRAGVEGTRVVAEIVITNASTVDGIFDALGQDPDQAASFCSVAMNPAFTLLGAAHYGTVWVLDFGTPYATPVTPPRSPNAANPGAGTSGPGNSGTGGH